MSLLRILGLTGFLLLAGCALPGNETRQPPPEVVEKGRPYESASPYESRPSAVPGGKDDGAAAASSADPGETNHGAPVTRSGAAGELPVAAAALLAQAEDHRANGRLGDAAATLERALRIAPREPRIYRELAEVRLQQGKTAQAEQFARKGISLAAESSDEQARLWTVVAECRWAAKDSEGALAAERKAKELRGSSWQFW